MNREQQIKIYICLLLFILLSFLSSCSPTTPSKKLTISPLSPLEETKVTQLQPIHYKKFSEAMNAFDFSAAKTFLAPEQKDYLQAMLLVQQNKIPQAILLFKRLQRKSKNLYIRLFSYTYLKRLLYYQEEWRDFLNYHRPSSLDSNPYYIMSKAMTRRPAEKVLFSSNESQPVSIVKTTLLQGIPALEVEVNGCKQFFLLKTESPFSIVNEEVAQNCGITPLSKQKGKILPEIYGRPAQIQSLKLGNLEVQNHPVMLIPKAEMNKPVAGILGWPLLKKLIVEINLPEGKTLLQPANVSSINKTQKQQERNFFFFLHPTVFIQNLEGRKLAFLLKTGNVESYLHSPIQKKALPFSLQQGGFLLHWNELNIQESISFDGALGSDIYQNHRLLLDLSHGILELLPLSGQG